MRLPLGENTALYITPVWPWMMASGLPSRSHSAVWPKEAVRMRSPSGANTALKTSVVRPFKTVRSLCPRRAS